MDSAARAVPGLRSLYPSDRILAKSVRTATFGVVVAVGIRWATSPLAGPTAEPTFEAMAAPWISLGGMVMTGFALVVLVWRYRRRKKILAEGSLIKGVVDDIEVCAWNTSDDSDSPSMQSYRRICWAVFRYTMQGRERTVRVKLPNSGFTQGLAKGRETDLIVHDSAPGRPLIRSVYYRS